MSGQDVASPSAVDWEGLRDGRPVALDVGGGRLPAGAGSVVADLLYDAVRDSWAINQVPREVLEAALDVQAAADALDEKIRALGRVAIEQLSGRSPGPPEHEDEGGRPIRRTAAEKRDAPLDRDDFGDDDGQTTPP